MRRLQLSAVLGVLFAILTIGVLTGSPLDTLDHWARELSVHHHNPAWKTFVLDYVLLGKRGPTTKIAFFWFLYLCWRRRSLDPMLVLASAVLMNNLFVGIVKLSTGRWGPGVTANPTAVFSGGDIFPSGHVTNCVVLYGVIAMTAAPAWRKPLAAIAIWISVTVGFGTLWLDTHWFTDVLGGWIAGGIVLLLVPRYEGFTDRCVRWVKKRRDLRRARTAPRPTLTPDTSPDSGGARAA
jgi:membrane-associated phospholipid phosphatase